MDTGCGSASGTPATALFSAQSNAVICSGTKTKTVDPVGTVKWSYSGFVSHAPSGCDKASSCVGGVTTSSSVQGTAGMIAEFTYKAVGGLDWYESIIVLYKQIGSSQNLDTDTIVTTKAIRGNRIQSGWACGVMARFTHSVCGGSTPNYACDSGSYITDIVTLASSGTHYLAFYAASYDRTGGGALGADMYIKGFQLLPATCTAACNQGAVSTPTCTSVTCSSGFTNPNGLASDGHCRTGL